MAFVKLYPPEGHDALPVTEVVERLRDEFDVVDEDPDAGQDHVAGMVAATLRLADAAPQKQEWLAWFQSVREAAVMVSFGDGLDAVACCCVMPDTELFFDRPDEVAGPARSLVERAAAALGYTIYDG